MTLHALEKRMNREALRPRVLMVISLTIIAGLAADSIYNAILSRSFIGAGLGSLTVFGIATYVWQTLRRVSQPAGTWLMEAPVADPVAMYHALPFDESTQAMMFIADMSKHMDACRKAGAALPPEAEVSLRAGAGGMIMYFNEAAMPVFDETFPAPPPMRSVKGRDLPARRSLMPIHPGQVWLPWVQTPRLPSP